jgi:hypothetical protein
MSIDPSSAPADELLQALTVGDLREDEPRVAARLRAEPPLRARWQELSTTLGELQLLAPLPAHAGESADPVVDTRAAVRAFRDAATPRRWWRLGMVLAAAAAALVLVWSLLPPPVQTPDPRLGGGEPAVTTPDVRWAVGQPLRWNAVREAVGYRLQLQTAPNGPLRTLPDPAHGDDLFPQPSWLPTAAERDALPVEFSWRAIAIDGSGQIVGTSAWSVVRR